MGNFKDIVDVLDCISDGINPTTKERFTRWDLLHDSDFQGALERLQKTYRIIERTGAYALYEREYPHHAIISVEKKFLLGSQQICYFIIKNLQLSPLC